MDRVEKMIAEAEEALKPQFAEADRIEELRTRQILDLFRENQVSYRHFAPSSGYGYDDVGRDTLERIWAGVFHTEAALMRPQIASGTAALSLTLFGLTRPGERILSATGMPYDTLLGVIGIGIKAILDVAGINHLVARHSAVPSAEVADYDNRL